MPPSGWGDLLRSLGGAFGDVLRSELDALGEDLSGSARRLAVICGLFLLALFGVFWAVGLLAYLSVEVLSFWLPRWAAALGVFLLVVLVALGLVAVARMRLRELEKPADTVRRHVREHVDWWETRVLGAPRPETTSEEEP